MRTFLKIFVTAAVLAGGFIAYLTFQPASTTRAAATSRPAIQPRKRSDGGMLIGEGENAWIRQFDDEGRLASRFRAEKWEPQKNGLVRVVHPEADLYLKGGRDRDRKDKSRSRVTIRGVDGEVTLQNLPDSSSADKPLAPGQGSAGMGGPSMGPAQPPSSGRLNGVVIQVFETEEATEPVVTMKTNNIVFDNETFRISTESFTTPDGKAVAPDEVPVSVEGPYFSFFGRGLVVRWNDLEERLELLRVAHGDHLVIKDVQALSGSGVLPAGLPAATSAPGGPAAEDTGDIPPLASAAPDAALTLARADKRRAATAGPTRAAAPATSPTSRPARRKERPVERDRDRQEPTYRAAFEDNVRVVQGEQQVALANLMNVDFLLGQKKDERPATRPTTAPAAQSQPASTQTATTQVASTQPAMTEAVTQPTTSPTSEPVTVYWTGELNVTPLATAATRPSTAPTPTTSPAVEPLSPGEGRVELLGSPVVLTHELLDVRTGRFVYKTNGSVFLDHSSDVPQIQITQRSQQENGVPTTVLTEGLTYSRGEQLATLRGRSHVLAPIESKPRGEGDAPGERAANAAPEMLDAAWRDLATFRLVGEREKDMWVQNAQFTGDVDVKAPQGNVRARQLELAFDPPAPAAEAKSDEQDGDAPSDRKKNSQPNLRRVVATDAVHCELLEKEGRRLLDCQLLTLDTARSDEGELYPRVIDAAGEVHASTTDRQLNPAEQLNATHVLLHLRPAKKPAPDDGAVPAGDRQSKSQLAVELESMTATDAVRVASADGGIATGKRLTVTLGPDGQPRIELSGDPARVEDKNGTLTGPRIQVDPHFGVAHVPGPGTLRAVQRDAKDGPDSPGRPIEVTWADSADVRGGENRIDVTGSVSLWITDTDGSVRTANAGRVTVELAKKPEAAAVAEKPKESKSDAKAQNASAVEQQFAQSMNMDVFKDKEVSRVHLYDNAVINSKLSAPDGRILKQLHVKSNHIAYDVRARHLSIPEHGQMLVESHEPAAVAAEGAADAAEPKQANASATGAGARDARAPAMSGGNGTTAFEWARSLEFDESEGKAVLDGSVVVSHQPDTKSGRKEPPVRMDADKLTALFDTQGKADGADKSADKGADKSAPGDFSSKMQLRSVVAEGNILVTREGSELSAERIEYDPTNEWVIARGSGRNPARFSDPSGAGTFRAGELWLNTNTWAVKAKDVNTRVGAASR